MAEFALFLRLSLVALVCCLGAPSSAQDVRSNLRFIDLDMISVREKQGLYAGNRDGLITEIAFPLDLDRLDPERGHEIARLGSTDNLVVMFDRYSVRQAAPGVCPSGYETYLRAFSSRQRRQVFVRLVAGCLDIGRTSFDELATWIEPDRFRVETAEAPTFKIVDDQVILETRMAR